MSKIFNKKIVIALLLALTTVFTCCFIGCKKDADAPTSFNITGFEENGVFADDMYTYIVLKTDLSSEKVLDSVWVKINSFGEKNVDGKIYAHVGAVDGLSVTISEGFMGMPSVSAKTKGTPIDAVAENKGWQTIAITQGKESTSGGAYVVGSKQYLVISILGQVDIEEVAVVYFEVKNSNPTGDYGLATCTIEAVGATKSVATTGSGTQSLLIKPLTDGSRMPTPELIPNATTLFDNQSLFDVDNIDRVAVNDYKYIEN